MQISCLNPSFARIIKEESDLEGVKLLHFVNAAIANGTEYERGRGRIQSYVQYSHEFIMMLV